ncbi:MAG: hypothetical protein J6Q76_02000 [Clostridia bacterium]|nr:hypothetical protein [Clostridia bacterium]
MLTVVGVCLLSAVAVITVRRFAPEYAMLVSLVAGSVVLIALIVTSSGLFTRIEEIFVASGLDIGIFKIVLKCLGLCYITNFAVDVCRDFGQTSLGSKVELAGKISVTVLTLPLVEDILKAAVELVR